MPSLAVLTQAALAGLRKLTRPGVAYHRAGVLLSGLERAGQTQLSLFSAPVADQPRRVHLMATLDSLNARFGRQLVHLAATGVTKAVDGKTPPPAWAGRAAHRSPQYTTGWAELWQLR